MKEAILKVLGQEITVQYVPEKNFIRYGKNFLKECMVKDGFTEESVEEDLQKFNDFIKRKELQQYLKENYEVKEYTQKLEWLKKKVEPEIIRLMKKVSNGSRLRIINGLVVREHPEIKGLYSLTDAWKASRSYFSKESSWKAKQPAIWKRDNQKSIKNLKKEIKSNMRNSSYYSQGELMIGIRGNTSKAGTYVHPRLLIAYTEFVHPRLHNKVLKVFEDYENGKLYTEETVSRKAKGTATREKSKPIHLGFRGQCQKRGASWQYAAGEIHKSLWGVTKQQKMKEENIKEPLRDNMLEEDLSLLSSAEQFSIIGMIKTNAQGSFEVLEACRDAGEYTKKSVETYLKNLQLKKRKRDLNLKVI